jgi:hypothetical protein
MAGFITDCNVYHRDWPLNPIAPDYSKFVFLAGHLGVDWKIVRDMYWSISYDDKNLVNEHIEGLRHKDNVTYLKMLDRTENQPSRILIPTL